MRYYTETIPVTLAEKLKEKGMPMLTSVSISIVGGKNVVDEDGNQWYCPTYAEVFDWLMEQGTDAEVFSMVYNSFGKKDKIYAYTVYSSKSINEFYNDEDTMTWHEAADAAIEKALTLI